MWNRTQNKDTSSPGSVSRQGEAGVRRFLPLASARVSLQEVKVIPSCACLKPSVDRSTGLLGESPKSLFGLVVSPPASSCTVDPSLRASQPYPVSLAPPTLALPCPPHPCALFPGQPLNFPPSHCSSVLCAWGKPSLCPRIDPVPPLYTVIAFCFSLVTVTTFII